MKRLFRRFRRYGFVGYFVLLLILLIVGLLLRRSFFAEYSTVVPASGGTLTDVSLGTIENLSPLNDTPTAAELDIFALTQATLLEYNPLTGETESGLADYALSADGRTYTLTIKPTARFSDGVPVHADDVVFTLSEVLQNPQMESHFYAQRLQYTAIESVDFQTVTIMLPEPNALFIRQLSIPVLPKKSYAGALIQEITDPDYPAHRKPLATGAYKVERLTRDDTGVKAFLSANEHYYKGSPLIENVVVQAYFSPEIMIDSTPWAGIFSRLQNGAAEKIEQKTTELYNKTAYLLPRWTGVFYNLDRPITALPQVREALEQSLDIQTLLPESWSTVASPFFFEGVNHALTSNKESARKAFDTTGMYYDPMKKVRTRDGAQVELKLITTAEPKVYAEVAQKIRRTWEQELNIAIDLRVLSQQEFLTALESRDYDAALYGQSFGLNRDMLSPWHSSQSGGLNLSNLTNEDVDQILYTLQLTGSQKDLTDLSEKLVKLRPATVLGSPMFSMFISNELKGVESFGKMRQHADRFFTVHNWHYSEVKQWNKKDQTEETWAQIFWGWLF